MGRRMWRWLFTLLVVAAAGTAIWHYSRPAPVVVKVQPVARGLVETTVANTRAGTVTACRRAKLSPSVGGQIEKLPVREGDHVKTGELLLSLWNHDLIAEAELAAREAASAHASAEASCLNAEEAARDARRQKSLQARKLVSEEQAEHAQTLAKTQAAQCEAARMSARVRDARIGVVRANIERTRLYAPFSGIVAEINGEVSEYVTPSPPGIPTPPAVDIIDNQCFYVSAPIDEVDVAAVRIGLPARITLDAFGKESFAGKVRRIGAYVIDVEKQARTVDVEVEFDNKGEYQRLLAGYSADVEIVLDVHDKVLRVPSEAILDGDRVFVLDGDSGTAVARTIKTGARNWNYTEIREGLAEGELLITNPDAEGVEDGAAVRREAER